MNTARVDIVQNIRRNHERKITAALFSELADILPQDIYEEVYNRIQSAVETNGFMIISDRDRSELGLEPRDVNGWTPSERMQQKRNELDALLTTSRVIAPLKP